MDSSSERAVLIIDDDPSMRSALERLLRTMGFRTITFPSAVEFLHTDYRPDSIGCLVLDVKMPGMSGIELQEELNRRDLPFPVIFITGHGTIPMSVRP
jgi:FixJ family two-component response regulator